MIGQTPQGYDAFISYAPADHAWVWDELLPRLERAGRCVLIDERDFIPGAPIPDEKERAVRQSRKTVMVLSPAYLESEWAEFDTLLAQTLDPAARKRQLIPVIHVPCRPGLRIRPLVSVDLTTNSEMQWRRLCNALDPAQATSVSPIQNLALAVSEPTAGLAAPGWHPLGTAWLGLGLLGAILLIGLIYLLLYPWPALRETASIMGAAFMAALGFFGVREDRDFFQRLSHFLGRGRLGQVGMGGVLAASLLLWGFVGWPRLQGLMTGPLGPRAPGVQRFAIGEWKNLTAGRSLYEGVWTEGTRRALYQKLCLVDGLQGVAVDSPQVTDEVRRDLDLWIDGDFSKIALVKLSAALVGRGGAHRGAVTVERNVDETSADVANEILHAQDALAKEILRALGFDPLKTGADVLSGVPTRSAEALQLNNEAARLLAAGRDLDRAETLLQRALRLDPNYADAHSNLGYLLRVRGDLTGAIAEYRKAAELLPRYPIFHYNLGLALDRAGQLDASAAAYQRALDLDPAYVAALNNLAFVYLEQGRPQDAAELLERGLQLQPQAPYLRKNLGRALLDQGSVQQAIPELEQATKLSDAPYAEAIFYLAQAYAQANERTKACEMLKQYAPLAAADALDDRARPTAARALANELSCP
jgi:tetratricopeptide (TPR) repeat protein